MSIQIFRRPSLKESEFGIVEAVRFEDSGPVDLIRDKDTKGHVHQKEVNSIVVSAIIFVTVVAVFSVISTIISNYFVDKTASDPRAKNTKLDILKTRITNQNLLLSNLIFASFVILCCFLFIPLLLKGTS